MWQQLICCIPQVQTMDETKEPRFRIESLRAALNDMQVIESQHFAVTASVHDDPYVRESDRWAFNRKRNALLLQAATTVLEDFTNGRYAHSEAKPDDIKDLSISSAPRDEEILILRQIESLQSLVNQYKTQYQNEHAWVQKLENENRLQKRTWHGKKVRMKRSVSKFKIAMIRLRY